jgi:Ca2+/H+ antiporter, TMEM165/GDT1 family
METFLVALVTVAAAEIGDRTQLLSLVLAAHYRKPWPMLAAILLATLANHLLAGLVGVWFGDWLRPGLLDGVVGVSMLGMALWTLVPDKLAAFFIAEIGDKTQIATMALAAGYASLGAVVAGTTVGMLLANAPVVFLGKAFADRLPMTAIHWAAAGLFAALGLFFLARALTG